MSKKCADCGKRIERRAYRCKPCSGKARRKNPLAGKPITKEAIRQIFHYRNGKLFWKNSGEEAGYPHKKGFWIVQIDHKSYTRAKLVWMYHNGKPERKLQHKNRIYTDDRIENLDYERPLPKVKRWGLPPNIYRTNYGFFVEVHSQYVGHFLTLEDAVEARDRYRKMFGLGDARPYKSAGWTTPERQQAKPSPIRIQGNLAYIALSKSAEAIIDVEDIPLVSGETWLHYYNGKKHIVRAAGRREHLHRRIAEQLIEPDMGGSLIQVRHKNGNSLDCRKKNLWIVDLKKGWTNERWTPGLARPNPDQTENGTDTESPRSLPASLPATPRTP